MPTSLLFFGYAIDLIWLFLAFMYAFVLCIGNSINIIQNKHLQGRRAYACLFLIASWFYYVYADATHAYRWLETDFTITNSEVIEKAAREWLSVITSIITTLLIAGCRFGDKKELLND